MKQADVEIGGRYLTKVGQELVRIEVVQKRVFTAYCSKRKQTTFYVKRVDNGRLLPKTRTSSALRELA